MAKQLIIETPSVNLIGPGTTIIGDINTTGDFRIDGTLIGSIKSTGKVVVGESGKLEGKIDCQNADLSGSITADIEVKQLLSLKSTARIKGDLKTSKLAIEIGAFFSGTCFMGETEASQNLGAGNSYDQTKIPATSK